MSDDKGLEHRRLKSCKQHGPRCDCPWQAMVYDAKAAKKLHKTFPTKTAAKLWRRDKMAALRRGEASADRGPLLRDATEAWLEAARAGHARNRSGDPFKPSAIRGYDQSLRLRVLPVLGDHRVREITTQEVQRFIDRLVRDGLAPATVDSTLTAMRSFYGYAVPRGEALANPTRGIRKPAVRCRVRVVVSPVEAAEMLAALNATDRPLWATAFYAGLRRGELIALRWEDVDLASGVIHVRRGWDAVEGEIAPKSRQGRRDVPVAAVLRDYLDEHRMNGDGTGHVFSSDRQVRAQAERAGDRWTDVGLQRLTLHDARHTYASLMIAAGVNAKTLSTFMGHANIAVTLDLYGHLLPGSETEAVGLFDAYLARQLGGSTSAPTSAQPSGVPV